MKTINICIGSACHLKGSYTVIEKFKSKIAEYKLEQQVELKAAFCMGECTKAVSVKFGDGEVVAVSPENAGEMFDKYIRKCD